MIKKINEIGELQESVRVLRESFATVAQTFNLTKENCPTNATFVKVTDLERQLSKGIEFYQLIKDKKQIGFIAIEKSNKHHGVYYIEKLAILPEYRHFGYGRQLMDFAIGRIKELGGNRASIGIIDANVRLKNWYLKQGFKITKTRNFYHLPFTVCFMEIKLFS